MNAQEAVQVLLALSANVAIAWLNAMVCGRAWVEAKHIGGIIRLVVWCGAIQSAIGFSMVYLVLLTYGLYLSQRLPVEAMRRLFALWYPAVVVPMLGSGLVVTVYSWQVAWRERSLARMGTAAWNTYAQVHNAMQAIDSIDAAINATLDGVRKLADSSDKRDKTAIVAVLLILVVALLGGVMTTTTLIKRCAGTVPLPQRRTADGSGGAQPARLAPAVHDR